MRTRSIAIVVVYSALVAASGAFLFGCDDATASSSKPDTTLQGPLTTIAVGAWQADTAVTIPNSYGISIAPTLQVDDTLRSDFSFTAALRVRNLLGNDVAGPVYVRSGVWASVGDSLLVLAPTTCLQGDTATVMGVPGLPFSSTVDGRFVANSLAPVPCGAPDTVRTRPLSTGHWAVPMNVNLGGLVSGRWTLDFVRQP